VLFSATDRVQLLLLLLLLLLVMLVMVYECRSRRLAMTET